MILGIGASGGIGGLISGREGSGSTSGEGLGPGLAIDAEYNITYFELNI